MKVVVVESPAKAKTINRYLGKDYRVLASFGHLRDLPSKDGSVDPSKDFAMTWKVEGQGHKHLKEISEAVRSSDGLILATDPDREGEAISWHIREELIQRKILKEKPVERVVFNEITKAAITKAFENPRQLDQDLIDAYLARRALDYLVGFTLSPVLWRKLPGSRSAGRVQSVALRIISEREAEIEIFKAKEYWKVFAQLANSESKLFSARLKSFEGKKIGEQGITDQAQAKRIEAALQGAKTFTLINLETKEQRRSPPPPFITSSLQMEASRKLGFSASHTMRIAQQLYEGVSIGGETVGLISYMRTDGITLSQEALMGVRDEIAKLYGSNYLPEKPRQYKSKAKNAQEAHEAIRPTSLARYPDKLAKQLNPDQLKLYRLIWERTMACQMEQARFEQVGATIGVDQGLAELRAVGSRLVFDGFMKIYREGRDEDGEENEKLLPKLEKGEVLTSKQIDCSQHFTQPPPRYTEASLVKQLEQLGIGRPSTYASILQVLQDRGYVKLERKRFIPADRGRVVTSFLVKFFGRYVEYDFTADLEERLDSISAGKLAWKKVMQEFWTDFHKAIEEAQGLRLTEVIDVLDQELDEHFFPTSESNPKPRACPQCDDGRLGIKLGRTGGFIGCSNYPDCRYTRTLSVSDENAPEPPAEQSLGIDPESQLLVLLKKGPYGWYIQLGDQVAKGEKPKRSSLPKDLSPDQVTLDQALKLLALPRELGEHEGEMITAGLGRYGPYVKKGSTYKSLSNEDSVLTIGLNRAVALLEDAKGKAKGKEIGKHPDDGAAIQLLSGRYGPYVKHGKLNASLKRNQDPESLTLDEAVALLAAQKEKAKTRGKKSRS